jgi:hypothetical protein
MAVMAVPSVPVAATMPKGREVSAHDCEFGAGALRWSSALTVTIQL